MTTLILLSACVSLITLGVLFIQRIRPKKIQIPSFFLAQKNESRVNNLKRTPPKWWEVLLVLGATLGTAAAFYVQQRPQQNKDSRGEGLIWFDTTLSHLAALNSSGAARESTLDSLQELRLKEYIFVNLSFIAKEDNQFQPTYEFQKISADTLKEHLDTLMRSPSALSQPLVPSVLTQDVKLKLSRDSNQFNLFLITDAQAETLRNLSPLRDSFQTVSVLRTPSSENIVRGKSVEIVPDELARVWNKNSDEQSGFLPGTPQFIQLSANLKKQIPPQARPSISLEFFDSEDTDSVGPQASSLTLFTGEEVEQENSNRPKTPQPLLTTCTLSIAGPGELDGMSDIRAYAQYFRIPIRPLACRGTESFTSALGSETFDPWKYRKASLWVIPVNEIVASDLFQKQEFWIPEGFAPQTDALVYIADTRMQGFSDFLEQALIQLEKNQPALLMPLLPLPPKNLSFPWRTSERRTIQPTEEQNLDIMKNAQMAPAVRLKAADGTPLAFTLSQTPPVVYLRTGGAAPNGELGRWGQWAKLWNELKSRIEQSSPLLTRVQITHPQNWAQWNDELLKNKTPALRYRIDPQSMRGTLIAEKSKLISPTPGLYVRERDDHLLLIEPPATERQGGLLSQAEVEQLFPVRTQGPLAGTESPTKASASQFAGAALALLSLLTLWIMQRRVYSVPAVSKASAALLICFGTWISSSANAQAERPPPFDSRLLLAPEQRSSIINHPFRIGWCDAVIPPDVLKRYSYLQKLLANRGTIEMPQMLKPGACQVGAAEIWWTSSLDALQAAPVAQHIRSGGVIIAEGIALKEIPDWMVASADSSIGLVWESPKRRGMLYRSFYLLSSFDGCTPEKTLMLTLRKKINAQAPMALVTPARFLTIDSEGADCFITDDDYRTRSFVNMMYALLTTDYKEDQMQLPEILNRVRNLGLEP